MSQHLLKKVIIEWIDTTSIYQWQSLKEAQTTDLDICESIGYMIRDEKDFVSIVQTKTSSGEDVDGLLIIPRSAIKKVTDIVD
jgi:hypothetical protein